MSVYLYLVECLQYIRKSFSGEDKLVQGSMGGVLVGIGKRNARLNTAALKVAKTIGPIQLESNGSKCEPFDVVKHLTSDYIRKILGV